MKAYFRWFVYGSLAFLAAYLVRRGVFVVPKIESPASAALSVVALLGGFLATVLGWKALLARFRLRSSFYECLASMGLSVFGKYVPGKLWILLGRAEYIASRRRSSRTTAFAVSLNDQFISIWTGLVIGTACLFLFGELEHYGWLLLMAWLALSALIFLPWFHGGAERILARLYGQPVHFPPLDLRSFAAVAVWSLGSWAAWSVGFYLMTRAIVPQAATPAVGLAFPLAATLGILAIVAPGGLGVREGVIVGILVVSGLETAQAVTVSIAARGWFLFGETMFFVAGALAAGRRTPEIPEVT